MNVLLIEGACITVLSVVWATKFVFRVTNKDYRKWARFGFDKYKLEKVEDMEEFVEAGGQTILKKKTRFKVKVLIKGSFDDFKKNQGMLEKAYEGKCKIEDVENSKYINFYIYKD